MKRSTRMPCTPKSDSAPTPFSRSPLEPNDKLQKVLEGSGGTLKTVMEVHLIQH